MVRDISMAMALAMVCVAPARASNTLIAQGQPVAVAKSPMTVTPDREWNKLGARPGRSSETWTIDGDGLNDVTFYGGIETSRPLFREVSKRTKPLPHFSSTMLLTDLPVLFENSYSIALDTQLLKIAALAPPLSLGQKGIRFSYSFSRADEEVRRKGEASAAIIGGKLYMITFEAPDVYYYQRDVAAYRAIVAQATIAR
uniref:hypothetical protein n=1 Tax=uncultured Sphingomonas sp. TaxID=158754 RepID=UPI0035CC32AE